MAENYFGEDVAARYDADLDEWGKRETVEATVDFLADLADGGTVLELGIGTGRIALPLSVRGVRVAGIDLSEPMVARLRAKPGGSDITVVMGDFTTTRVEGAFALAYVVLTRS